MPLDALTSKHSIQNALALARTSQLVYASEPEVRAGVGDIIGQPLRDFKFFEVLPTGTQAFLAGFDSAIVLCFRGSSELRDWLQNGQIALVPFHVDGAVHIGFHNAVESVLPLIEQTLEQWSGQGRTFWITGHSLGGALAMLTAAYLRFPADPARRVPRPLAGLYTFGQPRVGTKSFCRVCSDDFGSIYFRYTNNQDLVTRVPPRELSYWHTGRDQYISSDGVIHEDPAWWLIFIDRIKVGLSTLIDMQQGRFTIDPRKLQTAAALPITDHFMTKYVVQIEKNLR